MGRWLVAHNITQEGFKNIKFEPEKHDITYEIDQPDLFDSFYDTHKKVKNNYNIEIYFRDCEYDIKGYNSDYDSISSIASFIIFPNVPIIKESITTNLDESGVLEKIRSYLYSNSDEYEAFKVVINDNIYYLIDCGTRRYGMEIESTIEDLAGKLISFEISKRKSGR